MLAGLMQVGLGFLKLGKYIRYIPYPVVSGFMTAIGLIILITQVLPVLGYYAKEDTAYVETFKPQAEAIILGNILDEEAGEGLLVLEDFSEQFQEEKPLLIRKSWKNHKLCRKSASGVLGALRVMPSALQTLVG